MSENWSDIESERDGDCPLEGQPDGYPSDHQADCQLSMEFHQRCQMELYYMEFHQRCQMEFTQRCQMEFYQRCQMEKQQFVS